MVNLLPDATHLQNPGYPRMGIQENWGRQWHRGVARSERDLVADREAEHEFVAKLRKSCDHVFIGPLLRVLANFLGSHVPFMDIIRLGSGLAEFGIPRRHHARASRGSWHSEADLPTHCRSRRSGKGNIGVRPTRRLPCYMPLKQGQYDHGQTERNRRWTSDGIPLSDFPF